MKLAMTYQVQRKREKERVPSHVKGVVMKYWSQRVRMRYKTSLTYHFFLCFFTAPSALSLGNFYLCKIAWCGFSSLLECKVKYSFPFSFSCFSFIFLILFLTLFEIWNRITVLFCTNWISRVNKKIIISKKNWFLCAVVSSQVCSV